MTSLPYSLGCNVNEGALGANGSDVDILSELLDLLDLTGELSGECLLQRLQLSLLDGIDRADGCRRRTWVLPAE
jgi:hypothetical protein